MSADRWERVDRLFIEAMQLPAESEPIAWHVSAEPTKRCGTRCSRYSRQPRAPERFWSGRPSSGWAGRWPTTDGVFARANVWAPISFASCWAQVGRGEVWRATDERLNRDVAIKLLRPHLSSDPQRARRFAEEARTAAR